MGLKEIGISLDKQEILLILLIKYAVMSFTEHQITGLNSTIALADP